MNIWPDLRPILKDVKWAIIGGVATRAYMPERMTKDMDILVHESDGGVVIKQLEKAGYRISSQLAVPGYLMISEVKGCQQMLPQPRVLFDKHPVPHRQHRRHAALADQFQSSQQERGK